MYLLSRIGSSLIIFITFVNLFLSCSNEKGTSDKFNSNTITKLKMDNEDKFEKIKIKLGKKQLEISLGYHIEKQKNNNRKWVKINVTKDLNIGGIIDTTFYFPTQVRTDFNDNIYVLDMGGKCVKKFDSKGKFIKIFGRKGKGPGEFQSPARMDVLPDGKIIVLDPNLNKCAIFDGENVRVCKIICVNEILYYKTFSSLSSKIIDK